MNLYMINAERSRGKLAMAYQLKNKQLVIDIAEPGDYKEAVLIIVDLLREPLFLREIIASVCRRV